MKINFEIISDPAIAKYNLKIKKTMDNNVVIQDHPDIDIVFVSKARKIVLFPKEQYSDEVYETQNLLMKHLQKEYLISGQTIRVGNIFGTLEAEMILSEKFNIANACIMSVAKFLENEKEQFALDKEYEKMYMKSIVSPTDEDSTELGEVEHGEDKGSIRPGYIRDFGYGYHYLYEKKEKGKG